MSTRAGSASSAAPGGMGSLFARVYGDAGWEVSVRGRTGHEPMAAFLARQDVVMVSVPIDATLGVIAAVAPHLRPDQLLCDLTSLKAAPVEEMRRSPAPAVGLHPIFGPSVGTLAGQTVAVTPATATAAEYGPLLEVLEAAGARLAFTTPERHDEVMAVVQGLAHTLSLVLAGTMREPRLRPRRGPRVHVPGLPDRVRARRPAPRAGPGPLRPESSAGIHTSRPSLRPPARPSRKLADAVADPGPGAFVRLFEEDAALFEPVRGGRDNRDRPPDPLPRGARGMTLVTLGPAGTFSHELAARLDPDVRLRPSIAAVFEAVASGEGDGLVPLENSEAGSVGATLVGLADHPVSITGECTIPVRHHLATADPARVPGRVYAHPQTAEQCSRRIEALGLPVIPTASNAASAIAARADPSGAALVSEGLAARYGLAVLERDCQNSGTNETRFVRIARTPVAPAPAPCRASLLLDPLEERAGLLHALLAPFAARGLNLSPIESRPSRRGLARVPVLRRRDWNPAWDDAVAELGRLCTVKDSGRYGGLESP